MPDFYVNKRHKGPDDENLEAGFTNRGRKSHNLAKAIKIEVKITPDLT